jgi:hypothetical protein
MKRSEIIKLVFFVFLLIGIIVLHKQNNKLEKKIFRHKMKLAKFQKNLKRVLFLQKERNKFLFPGRKNFLFQLKALIKRIGLIDNLVSMNLSQEEKVNNSFRKSVTFSLSGLSWGNVLEFFYQIEKSSLPFLWERIKMKIGDKIDLQGNIAVFSPKDAQ